MGQVAAVAGASGYTGGELLRLLSDHPGLDVGPVFGASSAGRTVGSVHRHLSALRSRRLDDVETLVTDPRTALAGVDVLFLALPHGQSGPVAAAVAAAFSSGPAAPDRPVLVDLGADHRLATADDWTRWYGADTPHAGTWTYGLPEVGDLREQVARSTSVANPGCYPTSVALAMAPVLAAGLAEPEAEVVVVAASGTSGAGRSASGALLATEVMGSLSAYKAGGSHQHTPEMAQTLSRAAGREVAVSFTPVLAPMPRGILATCSVSARAGAGTAEVLDALAGAYDGERFVTVLDEGQWPRTADVVGSNCAHVAAAVDEVAGRVVVICAIDNLVKGAAGQAIQNANLALGLDEARGLPVDGVAP